MCSAIFKGADMFRIFLKNIPSLVLRIHQWSNYRQRKQKRRPHSWLVFPWRTTCWTERGLWQVTQNIPNLCPVLTNSRRFFGSRVPKSFSFPLTVVWFDITAFQKRWSQLFFVSQQLSLSAFKVWSCLFTQSCLNSKSIVGYERIICCTDDEYLKEKVKKRRINPPHNALTKCNIMHSIFSLYDLKSYYIC